MRKVESLDRLAALEPSDARAILLHCIGTANYDGGGKQITYTVDGKTAVIMTYRGTQVKLVGGGGLRPDVIAKIEECLDRMSEPESDFYTCFYVMSDRPVDAGWNYRSRFQILPPPEAAPKPPAIIGDWPFLVEVKYSAPDLPVVKSERERRFVDELRNILPVLMLGPSGSPLYSRGSYAWFLSGTLDNSMLGHVGYNFSGHSLVRDTFSDITSCGTLRPINDSEYYDPRFRRVEDVLALGESTESLFDVYFQMARATRRRFRRACHWFNLGKFLWNLSPSMSFVALAVAVETLIDSIPPHVCPECDEPHHASITKAFGKFLRDFVPDGPERQKFYNLRSDLAHGSRLMVRDEGDLFNWFHPAALDEGSQHSEILGVCRVALVNWLGSQGVDGNRIIVRRSIAPTF